MPLQLLHSSDARFAEAFARLVARRESERSEVDQAVAAILADVRERGDAALLEATRRFDGYRLGPSEIEVPRSEIESAGERLEPAQREALRVAAERIREFHASQRPESWRLERDGDLLGQELRPLERIGIYVPGAQAPLASSLLMLGIPAEVAGVEERVVVSPARRHAPAILEAARLAGISRVFRVGGAQSIAALAYGTETLPAVDKIVGPGSVWTQAAKRQVFGRVAIDSDAGPSEVLVLADSSARPDWVAADLLAQAEHDEAASVVLATPSESLARDSLAHLERLLTETPRAAVARHSLASRSLAIVTRDLDEAIELSNRYAPEHLEIVTREPEALLPRVRHAGAVFLGGRSTVPLGDYVAGPSHVLPTGGSARFFSVLGVEDFLRRMSVIRLGSATVRQVGPHAIVLAELEGLFAHAAALRARLEELGD
ncbi:MAG: histidinol dehydrogenase [Myxococcota bacterium]